MAAMKKVLSPSSETMITERAAKKPCRNRSSEMDEPENTNNDYNRKIYKQNPHHRTLNPGFNQGVHPSFHITNVGGEPSVKPGVWRSEMRAQERV
jgi:hypothetical protein